jgi:hypothetical protein
MFSNSTEGGMFTAKWCARCRFAFEGRELCDEAAVILFGQDPPTFLRRVEPTAADPTGVVCDRFEVTP